jgi:hypothetical protein
MFNPRFKKLYENSLFELYKIISKFMVCIYLVMLSKYNLYTLYFVMVLIWVNCIWQYELWRWTLNIKLDKLCNEWSINKVLCYVECYLKYSYDYVNSYVNIFIGVENTLHSTDGLKIIYIGILPNFGIFFLYFREDFVKYIHSICRV